jgi:hypothetical protein
MFETARGNMEYFMALLFHKSLHFSNPLIYGNWDFPNRARQAAQHGFAGNRDLVLFLPALRQGMEQTTCSGLLRTFYLSGPADFYLRIVSITSINLRTGSKYGITLSLSKSNKSS